MPDQVLIEPNLLDTFFQNLKTAFWIQFFIQIIYNPLVNTEGLFVVVMMKN